MSAYVGIHLVENFFLSMVSQVKYDPKHACHALIMTITSPQVPNGSFFLPSPSANERGWLTRYGRTDLMPRAPPQTPLPSAAAATALRTSHAQFRRLDGGRARGDRAGERSTMQGEAPVANRVSPAKERVAWRDSVDHTCAIELDIARRCRCWLCSGAQR